MPWFEMKTNKLAINWFILLRVKRILDYQKFNPNLTMKTCGFHFARKYNKNQKDPTKISKIHFNELFCSGKPQTKTDFLKMFPCPNSEGVHFF